MGKQNKLFHSIKDMYVADTPAPDGRRQNQKNLLVLALYCNMRRTLGIGYKRKYYCTVYAEMHTESTICNTSNNNLAALESKRIKTPFKLIIYF
jgi:hypothetical protein